MKVYGYKNCDTCRKALKWLDAAGAGYEFVDITVTPPPVAVLEAALAGGRYQLKNLFNVSGGRYRERNLKAELPGMSQGDALALLAGDGMLCKRPVAVDGTTVTVGFKPEVYGEVWG